MLLLLGAQITSPSCCWFWVFCPSEHAERPWEAAPSLGSVCPCWMLTMDVHSHCIYVCAPTARAPTKQHPHSLCFSRNSIMPQGAIFHGKPFSYLPWSVIWHDFCPLIELSSLTSPGLSSFSTRHKKIPLLCIPSKLCCPPAPSLSPQHTRLTHLPPQRGKCWCSSAFFKHPFS